MQKSLFKRSNGKNVFTDFKHHAKSWSNSKRLRARMDRLVSRKQTKEEQDGSLDENIER